jgi:hypothetical protein
MIYISGFWSGEKATRMRTPETWRSLGGGRRGPFRPNSPRASEANSWAKRRATRRSSTTRMWLRFRLMPVSVKLVEPVRRSALEHRQERDRGAAQTHNAGAHIDEHTCRSEWRGERLDLDYVVGVLM